MAFLSRAHQFTEIIGHYPHPLDFLKFLYKLYVFKGLPEIYEETEGGELTWKRKKRKKKRK